MNYKAWLQWASEHQGRSLFLVFLLLGASPVIFAPAAGLKLLKVSRGHHFKLAKWTAWFLLGTAAEICCTLIANIDPPVGVIGSTGIHYTTWYAWWFWTGQFCRWSTASVLSWYILAPKD